MRWLYVLQLKGTKNIKREILNDSEKNSSANCTMDRKKTCNKNSCKFHFCALTLLWEIQNFPHFISIISFSFLNNVHPYLGADKSVKLGCEISLNLWVSEALFFFFFLFQEQISDCKVVVVVFCAIRPLSLTWRITKFSSKNNDGFSFWFYNFFSLWFIACFNCCADNGNKTGFLIVLLLFVL